MCPLSEGQIHKLFAETCINGKYKTESNENTVETTEKLNLTIKLTVKCNIKGQSVGSDFENKPHLASVYQEQRERRNSLNTVCQPVPLLQRTSTGPTQKPYPLALLQQHKLGCSVSGCSCDQ